MCQLRSGKVNFGCKRSLDHTLHLLVQLCNSEYRADASISVDLRVPTAAVSAHNVQLPSMQIVLGGQSASPVIQVHSQATRRLSNAHHVCQGNMQGLELSPVLNVGKAIFRAGVPVSISKHPIKL